MCFWHFGACQAFLIKNFVLFLKRHFNVTEETKNQFISVDLTSEKTVRKCKN